MKAWIKTHIGLTVLIALIFVFAIIVASKEFWYNLFIFGLIAATVAVLVALVRPSAFGKLFHGNIFQGQVTRSRVLKYLGLLIVALLIGGVITAPPTDATSSNASTTTQTAAPAPTPQQKPTPAQAPAPQPKPSKPTYQATVLRSNTLDPATRVVMVTVKNTGAVTGSPNCFVRATSISGTYRGYDSFGPNEAAVLKDLEPGEETTFVARLTITKEGAEYATEATAECK